LPALQKRDTKSAMSTREPAGPARGVLRSLVPDGETEHHRLRPSPALAEHVAHFWWVRWSLRSPFVAETLPHPSVHVVFEAPLARAEVRGVSARRFTRTLTGEGRVLGIKFRPAVFPSFAGVDAVSLRDRVSPLEALLGAPGRALARSVDLDAGFEAAISVAEPHLAALARPLGSEVRELRELVEHIERDRELIRVEDAARHAGVGVRTLERRFRAHVGLSPKTVIRRYRLIEAAERLKSDAPPPLAELAASLGYSDQAHFTRDFTAAIGRAPMRFLSDERRPLAAP
jgi:AraC-like DNA-binding protein